MADGSRLATSVAVLFARADSCYKSFPSCDVYDFERDARTYVGTLPVIAHPPCRSWARLRQFAKPRPDEKALALFAVDQVRRCGGVLEHPEKSTLWEACGLPLPGCGYDDFGGWTLGIAQKDFGHRAHKSTWIYVVGVSPGDLPPPLFSLVQATHVIAQGRTLPNGDRIRKGHPSWRPEVTRAEREHTPPLLAAWLVAVARAARGVRHG
jgi:hypothetical protein